jgi:hypothetical protein
MANGSFSLGNDYFDNPAFHLYFGLDQPGENDV